MSDLREAAQQALEALETLKIALRVGMPEYGAEDQDELLETAITALRAALAEPDYWQEEARRYAGNADYWRKRYEALAEPVQPVAWIHPQYGHMQGRTETMSPDVVASYERGGWTPLYTAPPQRKPLTDEEIREMFFAELHALPSYPSAPEELPERFARSVERAHGIGGSDE